MHNPSPAPSARDHAADPSHPGASLREPMRTCAGCRKVDRQRDLVRATADSAGRLHLQSDRRRSPGRGTYVHRDAACLQAALAGGFARSLRRRVCGLGEPAPAARSGSWLWAASTSQARNPRAARPEALSPSIAAGPAGATSVKNQEEHS
ncbi:MAG: YlxR family protein [Polyangia bacterium]